MANALNSLASLAHDSNIDARNVRNAIEEDALHQARLLEKELKSLVDLVGNMRGSIKSVLTVAESVGKSLETGVIDVDASVSVNANVNANATTSSTVGAESSGIDGGIMEESKLLSEEEGVEDSGTFEEERKLAALLADAFQEREEASKKYEAISKFLEKYNLDEKDSTLLEKYNFENVFDGDIDADRNHMKNVRFGSTVDHNENGDHNLKNGMEFLDALQRVTKIRKELASSFDDESIMTTSTGGNKDSTSNSLQSSSATSHLGATSAMRMVETLASKQERAFERLYHFLHNHLDLNQAAVAHVPTSSSGVASASSLRHQSRTSEDEDGMDETLGHPFVKRALVVLKHVPAYYTHTLEMIATSRRSEVTRKFLLALTSGYNGMAPIEMKSHDPVNYVGDMLAFAFRTISVESELAKGLAFTNDYDARPDDDEEGKTEMNENDDFNISFMSASDVLNDAMSGVARPLKSRISQVIGSLARRPDEDEDNNRLGYDGLNENGFVDEEAGSARVRLSYLYSICGLLLFYRSAIEKAVNKLNTKKDGSHSSSEISKVDGQVSHSNHLVQCLSECLEDAARGYVASLKVYCAMLDQLASISHESQAQLCQTVILRLCDVRSTSPGFGPDFDKEMVEVSKVASEALSLEFLCDTVVEAIMPSCNNIDDIVAIKSALNGAKKAGLSSDDMSKWDEKITKEEEKMIDSQISTDTNYVLDECGLGSIASALESMKAVYIEGMVISSHPGLSEQSLQDAMKKFYASLIDPPFPSYDNIKDPVLRKRSRNKIAKNVSDMYEEIYSMVTSEKGGYGDLSFLEHSPDQVKTLIMS
jgi:hypothetical protein